MVYGLVYNAVVLAVAAVFFTLFISITLKTFSFNHETLRGHISHSIFNRNSEIKQAEKYYFYKMWKAVAKETYKQYIVGVCFSFGYYDFV